MGGGSESSTNYFQCEVIIFLPSEIDQCQGTLFTKQELKYFAGCILGNRKYSCNAWKSVTLKGLPWHTWCYSVWWFFILIGTILFEFTAYIPYRLKKIFRNTTGILHIACPKAYGFSFFFSKPHGQLGNSNKHGLLRPFKAFTCSIHPIALCFVHND
jgi:hypothetical protein